MEKGAVALSHFGFVRQPPFFLFYFIVLFSFFSLNVKKVHETDRHPVGKKTCTFAMYIVIQALFSTFFKE